MSPLTPAALVPEVASRKVSATFSISECARRKRDAGEEVFALGFGQSPFPVPEPMVQECQAHAHVKDYLPVRGLPLLRETIADWARFHKGVPDVTAEDVLIGPGSKQLIYLLQAVLQCDLLLPRPAWVTYAPQAELLRRRVFWVETSAEKQWKMDPKDLDEACRLGDSDSPNRLFIFNNPCNPTGTAVTAQTVAELAAVARAHRLLVLADEIYDYQQFDGNHEPFAKHYPEGTITLTGISKWAGAGGWRLGAFVFPSSLRWLLNAMAVYASETHSCVAAPIQYGAVPAFAAHRDTPQGQYMRHYLKASRSILGAIGEAFAEVVCGGSPCDMIVPTGGFYAWIDAESGNRREAFVRKGITTSGQLAQRLLDETGVATLPGESYGWPPEKLCLHVAYVDFDGGAAIEAVGKLPRFSGKKDPAGDAQFVREYAPRVYQGAWKLREWLAQTRSPNEPLRELNGDPDRNRLTSKAEKPHLPTLGAGK